MSENIRTIQLGAATVSVINMGILSVNLADWLQLPESEWPSKYRLDLTQPIHLPIQCIYISLPEASILVDACRADIIADTSYAPPGYQPPPSLLTQLVAAGVRPEDIDHVIITHAHFDHYSGIIQEREGQDVPCFPQARHYLGRADWYQVQDALQDPASLQSRTLAIIQRQGLLDLVDQQRDLDNNVQIIAAPGETLGHQIVRIHSAGQTLYCLGDLYHHLLEVEYPAWTVHWADSEANYRSRRVLTEAALAEQAFLVATHIPGIGRLRQTTAGNVWEAI